MELCLGTVQFGMDYGISNQKKPDKLSTFEMLDYCFENNILTIDTAEAYGDAEEIMGEYLKSRRINRDRIRVITKLKPNVLDNLSISDYPSIIEQHLNESLSKLSLDYVDGYLLHSSRYVFNDDIISALSLMKKKGLTKKIGVSVYNPDEAFRCLENPQIGLMQLPYSIFDQRMKETGVFKSKEGANTEIHSRSTFVQGLITLSQNQIPTYLHDAKPIIQRIDDLCSQYGLSKIQVAINYVQLENKISHLVMGVDSMKQLRQNVDYFNNPIEDELLLKFEEVFKGLEAKIVMPSLWQKT